MGLEELVGARPAHDVDVIPVVAPRARKVALCDGEAHGLHQVQPRADASARARHIPRVLGDLRLHQHDVEHPCNLSLKRSDFCGSPRSPAETRLPMQVLTHQRAPARFRPLENRGTPVPALSAVAHPPFQARRRRSHMTEPRQRQTPPGARSRAHARPLHAHCFGLLGHLLFELFVQHEPLLLGSG